MQRRQGRVLVFRTAIVGMTALVAALVPQFGLFVNLIGYGHPLPFPPATYLHTVALKVTIATCLDGRAFTGPFIAFILPSLCHIKLFPAQSTQSKLLGYCIVVVGLVGSLVATTVSIIELDKAFSSSDGG